MRKSLIGFFTIVLLVLFVGPFICGIWLQQKYIELIAFTNLQGQVRVTLVDYQRGWFASDVRLMIEVEHATLQPMLDVLGAAPAAPAANYQIIVQQAIQHGPVIYHAAHDLPTWLGLAAIQNQITLSPDFTALFTALGVTHMSLKADNDFISLAGNYVNHLEFADLTLRDVEHDIDVQVNKITSRVWFWPREKRMSGLVALNKGIFKNATNSTLLDKCELTFNERLNQNNLWLGASSFSLPMLKHVRDAGLNFSLTQFNFNSTTEENAGLLDGNRTLEVAKIQLGEQVIGPLSLRISAKKLNMQAIIQALHVYKNALFDGMKTPEQLTEEISQLVPKMLVAGSEVKLEKLLLVTPLGRLQASGVVNWPLKNFTPPRTLDTLFDTAAAHVTAQMPKKMLQQIIEASAQLPIFVHQVAGSEQENLIEMTEQLQFAVQQHVLFVVELLAEHAITDEVANQLLLLQKQFVPMEDYSEAIKALFWAKKITLYDVYQLSFYYAQIQQPYQYLQNRASAYQNAITAQFTTQVNDLLQQGFIKQEKEDYLLSASWIDGKWQADTGNGVASY